MVFIVSAFLKRWWYEKCLSFKNKNKKQKQKLRWVEPWDILGQLIRTAADGSDLWEPQPTKVDVEHQVGLT